MITEETISRVKSSLQATKSFLALEVIERLEKENAGLKKNLERYSQKIAEQEETIDAQDEVKCVKLQKKIKGLEEQIESLTKENDVLIKGLGCETCSITGEYLKLNNTIRELEEENAELKAQIEKMKCCNNCKNAHYDWREQIFEGVCTKCKKYNKWELSK